MASADVIGLLENNNVNQDYYSSISTTTVSEVWLSQTSHSKLSYPLLIPSSFSLSAPLGRHTLSNHLSLGLPSGRFPPLVSIT
jgi:hypothetical protein